MTKDRLAQSGALTSRLSGSTFCRMLRHTILCSLVLVLFTAIASFAQAATQNGAAEFFKKAVGEWVGTCEQSTDGQKAENKYFHASIKQTGPTAFTGEFDYYRLDPKTGGPLPIGKSSFQITIQPDGTAKSTVNGQGIVMVNDSPKNQKHQLSEILTCSGNSLQGKGSGTISVSGMPLGLGKNGKVKNGSSTWSISNGILSMSQSIMVGFKALIFTKNFQFDAHYTARKGVNVASIMPKSLASAGR